MREKPDKPATSPAAVYNPLGRCRFLMSAADAAQLPADEQPEVAFVGRSNAGKSSALNALTGMRALARVSKTPGRTQLINLFDLPQGPRLVDLPGYGFAAVPDAIRRQWGKLVGGYVEQRRNLCGLILLMDIRHPLTDIDRTMLGWSGAHGHASHVLLTKSDKLGFGAAKNTLLSVQRSLNSDFPGVSCQLFSSHTPSGVEEARNRVAQWLGIEAQGPGHNTSA